MVSLHYDTKSLGRPRLLIKVPRVRRYRVVQWTTGNVGKSSVQAIAANPTLELVGCYAWSPDKVGRDVGELCGIDPLGRHRHRTTSTRCSR